ncbi:uncharacterized protein LOC135194251 [Vanessa tameamea]|uniref:Uncharacterized protein LOC135194251 n=1 Tax=Vanessa tameamea TaxID=334116 RepID=A0ABM4AWF1_VANTA
MAARLVLLLGISSIVMQNALSQCVNRVGCGQTVVEGLLPNQLLLREQGLPLLPTVPGPLCPGPLMPGPIIQEGFGYAPTVIQDSSVANSLANALQLLVVSNLLSSTLPGPCDNYPLDFVGLPTYNYIY